MSQDYIDLAEIDLNEDSMTYAHQIRCVVRRFGDQSFTTAHIRAVIRKRAEYKKLAKLPTLNNYIKDYLKYGLKSGELVVVDKSQRWTKGYVYQRTGL